VPRTHLVGLARVHQSGGPPRGRVIRLVDDGSLASLARLERLSSDCAVDLLEGPSDSLLVLLFDIQSDVGVVEWQARVAHHGMPSIDGDPFGRAAPAMILAAGRCRWSLRSAFHWSRQSRGPDPR